MNTPERHWMQRALELAERGRGHVEPNPLVGAVVVCDGRLVGEGWHQAYGQAHAEINALAAAGAAARGGTLYVTLEPCCHHGKTPPCTDAVLRAGLRRVVLAMLDPFPQVSGQGAAFLRAAGIEVETNAALDEARRLNAPYLKLLAKGQPYVHAKWAMSLDGKIASATGKSKWISNKASRGYVHTLRGLMDAIIVGGNTVRRDDPLLTVRPPGPRTPVRIVLSRPAHLAPTSQLVRTAHKAPALVVSAMPLEAEAAQLLQAAGCEVLSIPAADPAAQVRFLLDELGRRRMTNVLVEGGSEVLGSFRDAGAIEEVHVFIAPRLLGGAAAVSPMAGRGADEIASSLSLAEWHVEEIAGDLLVHGRVSQAR